MKTAAAGGRCCAGRAASASPCRSWMPCGRAGPRPQAARPRRFFVMTGVNGVVPQHLVPDRRREGLQAGRLDGARSSRCKANLIIPDGTHQDAARDHRRHRPRARRRQRHQRLDLQRQERHRRRRVDRSGDGQRHRRQLADQVADDRQQGLQLLLLHRRPQAGPPGRARSARRTSTACSPASPPPHRRRARPIPAPTRRSGQAARAREEHPRRGHGAVPEGGHEGGRRAIGSGWRSTWAPSARSRSS